MVAAREPSVVKSTTFSATNKNNSRRKYIEEEKKRASELFGWLLRLSRSAGAVERVARPAQRAHKNDNLQTTGGKIVSTAAAPQPWRADYHTLLANTAHC